MWIVDGIGTAQSCVACATSGGTAVSTRRCGSAYHSSSISTGVLAGFVYCCKVGIARRRCQIAAVQRGYFSYFVYQF